MGLAVRRRRFNVEEYRRMGEAGILADDPRIELIAGSIVVRERTGSRHAGAVDRVGHLFFGKLAGRAIVRIQNPVTFPDEMSELQPDITLLPPAPTSTRVLTRARPTSCCSSRWPIPLCGSTGG
jgi:Putative restriction endonuclease